MTLAAWAGLAGAARAADCAFAPAPAARLQSPATVGDYQPVLKACVAADGRKAVAIREMTVAGQKLALLADPEALTTRLERAACWTCSEMSEAELKSTRMGRAISESAEAPGLIHRGFLQNAGLTHGAAPGDFVTGDLCPSKRPLDRVFFTRLETASPHASVALGISGLWLIHHFDDFRWLVDQRNSGALDILWVDHTYHHPYLARLPLAANFLLTKGVDPEAEILDTERLLIANGETPSLFFRFPGLVSSDPLDAGGEPVPSGDAGRRRLAGQGAAAGKRLDRAGASQRQRTEGPRHVHPRPYARNNRRAARAADRGAGVAGAQWTSPEVRASFSRGHEPRIRSDTSAVWSALARCVTLDRSLGPPPSRPGAEALVFRKAARPPGARRHR